MANLSPSSLVIENNSSKTTFLSNVTSFLMSKKGIYLISAVVLVCIGIYYMKTRSSKSEQTQELPPAPPGYVTVPIEVVQRLQQNESNLQQQAIDENNFDENNFDENNFGKNNVPDLRHNTLDEEYEEEPIAQQNLTQQEMESIQAQLNAMQQQRANA